MYMLVVLCGELNALIDGRGRMRRVFVLLHLCPDRRSKADLKTIGRVFLTLFSHRLYPSKVLNNTLTTCELSFPIQAQVLTHERL